MDTHMTGPAPVRLANATLADLPEDIQRPRYDRSALTPGIVHVGLGNFHRAHQAWYLHRLMQDGRALDWAIIGAGVRPHDAVMRDRLLAQDCLTTLIELDPAGTSAEVIGSMIDYLPIEDGNGPLIGAMADPRIRIVALTITEGGYFTDPGTGAFNPSHPDIQHDVDTPGTPRTAFGAIVAALKLRRDGGHGPFAVQSCDNLQGNGSITRQTVLGLAMLSDPDLAQWIGQHCSFPNSMVDCIVPATGPKEIGLARKLGIADAAPVTHENFRQWVIEDDFCSGRPDWDRVGAVFTDDVHDFETMKIRILNAGHQVFANIAEIMDIPVVSDIMQHPTIRAFLRKVEIDEIVPLVVPVPGKTPLQYFELIEERFANPAIVDTARRIAFDGASRHPGMVIPTIREAVAAGTPVEGLALVEAAWCRQCYGTRENGAVIEPNDPVWDDLVAVAKRAKDDPKAWLEMRQYYGDLADKPVFADAFARWLGTIWADGIEAAMKAYLSGPQPG